MKPWRDAYSCAGSCCSASCQALIFRRRQTQQSCSVDVAARSPPHTMQVERLAGSLSGCASRFARRRIALGITGSDAGIRFFFICQLQYNTRAGRAQDAPRQRIPQLIWPRPRSSRSRALCPNHDAGFQRRHAPRALRARLNVGFAPTEHNHRRNRVCAYRAKSQPPHLFARRNVDHLVHLSPPSNRIDAGRAAPVVSFLQPVLHPSPSVRCGRGELAKGGKSRGPGRSGEIPSRSGRQTRA